MMYKLKVICMYCGRFLREHEVERKEEAGISHGICNECKHKFDGEIEELKR